MSGEFDSKTISIHHFCKTFFPIRGGIEVVTDVICSLLKNEYASTIISTTQESCASTRALEIQNYKSARVRLVRAYGAIFSLPIAPKIMSEVFRSLRRADVVCVHYPFPLLDVAISLFCFFSRAKIVVYWHSDIYSQKISKYLVFPFTFIMLSLAHRIVVATPPMLENNKLLTRFRGKVSIIPYGLFDTSESVIPPDCGKDYFIAIGRHVQYKGFDVLIRAVASSRQKVLIVGDGPLYDYHQDLASDLGIKELVVFVRDASDAEKKQLLEDSIGLVLPSVYPSEAFALVQLEAMQLGKAIINTKLKSGVPWVARDGEEAITVAPGSAKDLAEAMQALARDDSLRSELGRKGFARQRSTFSLHKFKSNLRLLFSF